MVFYISCFNVKFLIEQIVISVFTNHGLLNYDYDVCFGQQEHMAGF